MGGVRGEVGGVRAPQVSAGGVCDESAGGEVEVVQGRAVQAEGQGRSVCDLVAVGQDQLVYETTVLGECSVDESTSTYNADRQQHSSNTINSINTK